MARKLRTWFPGAFYHLMHRGVRRVAIFEDEMQFLEKVRIAQNFNNTVLLDQYAKALTVKVVVSKIYIFCSCRSSDIVLYLT